MFFTISWSAAVSALVIGFTSWLATKNPKLAGLLLALPISTLLALALQNFQNPSDASTSVKFARSIFAGVPLSLTFFIPFLLADKLGLSFWGLYALGLGILVICFILTHTFLKI
jgi:hypothetical protein